MRLYLIRHGETEYNSRGIVQGYAEVPLNDTGIRQAALLGQRIADMPLDHIYASDLRRATMTASIVAAYSGTSIEYDIGFRERDPGPELTDKPHEEAMAFFTDPDYEPPGGESVPVFSARVKKAFDDLLEREAHTDRTIAVVSHGMVCGAFLRVCINMPPEEIEGASWPNTSLTIADYNGSWKIDTLGDVSHLDNFADTSGHATGA